LTDRRPALVKIGKDKLPGNDFLTFVFFFVGNKQASQTAYFVKFNHLQHLPFGERQLLPFTQLMGSIRSWKPIKRRQIWTNDLCT